MIAKPTGSKIHGMRIMTVNGDEIRNTKDIDFTNYGQPLRFKFIPENELWIDKENHPNEKRFLIIDAYVEYREMKKGKSYEQVLDTVKNIDHSERRAAHQHLQFKKKFTGIKDGIKIFIVEGDYVRTKLDPFFTEGGHGYVYSYIPKDEVWLDDDLVPKERKYVLLHEMTERHLMKSKKYSYLRAHKEASRIEKQERQKGGL